MFCALRATVEKCISMCDNFGWRGNTGGSLENLQTCFFKFEPKSEGNLETTKAGVIVMRQVTKSRLPRVTDNGINYRPAVIYELVGAGRVHEVLTSTLFLLPVLLSLQMCCVAEKKQH